MGEKIKKLIGVQGDFRTAILPMINYSYIFVHGLMGWGSYDFYYPIMPYWGMFGGDLMKYLNNSGFECYAASVAGTDSAWDRACELYAQLTGTVTDYGKAHSEKYGHDRYGKDFTGKALIDEWDAENKITSSATPSAVQR